MSPGQPDRLWDGREPAIRRVPAGPVGPPVPRQKSAFYQSPYQLAVDKVSRYPKGAGVPRLPLGAVVMPVSRPLSESAPSIATASEIATDAGAPLILLCSSAAIGIRVPMHLVPNTRCPMVIVDLTDQALGQVRDLLNPLESLNRAITPPTGPASDVWLKRNLALILAQQCGWPTVFTLDDDVRLTPPQGQPAFTDGWATGAEGVDQLQLGHALADMANDPQLQVVAYDAVAYADHSVVGHVRVELGLPADSFLGAGAQLIRCTEGPPAFFPDWYNEDWLFALAVILAGEGIMPSRAVKYGGLVYQEEFDPYQPVHRAKDQEFGDLLAEGLLRLLGSAHLLAEASTARYWQVAGQARQREIHSLLANPELDRLDGRNASRFNSLSGALCVYQPGSGWADQLAEWVVSWQHDLDTAWPKVLDALAPPKRSAASPLEAALAGLGLAGNCRWLGGLSGGKFTALQRPGRRGHRG